MHIRIIAGNALLFVGWNEKYYKKKIKFLSVDHRRARFVIVMNSEIDFFDNWCWRSTLFKQLKNPKWIL